MKYGQAESKLSAEAAQELGSLNLSRLRDPGGVMPDGLRLRTSLGRVVLLSSVEIAVLCRELPKHFPEYFSDGL